MISVLILDDNVEKLRKLAELLSNLIGMSTDDIAIAPDVLTARRLLMNQQFDLLILDIQVPQRYDKRAQPDGGLQFLQELNISKRYRVPHYIIGTTAHNDSYLTANPVFQRQLLGLVKYEENSDQWVHNITAHVNFILAARRSETIPVTKYDFDIAVICALSAVELESIKRLFQNWTIHQIQNDSAAYYTTVLKRDDGRILRIVAASAPQMGMTASAVLAMNLIRHFSPRYLIMTGITAGIRGKVNLGDILVADPSWDYGNGKVILDAEGHTVLQPDPRQIRLNQDVRAKTELLKNDTTFFDNIKHGFPGQVPDTSLTLHIGPVASGAQVLANEQVTESIQEQSRKLIGIEMETYGVMYAAENCPKPRPVALSIKSVCDFADSGKNDQYQYYASYTSASVFYELASRYLDFEEDY